MQTIEQPAHPIAEATAPLWLGSTPGPWGDVVHSVDPNASHSAATTESRREPAGRARSSAWARAGERGADPVGRLARPIALGAFACPFSARRGQGEGAPDGVGPYAFAPVQVTRWFRGQRNQGAR